MKGPGGARGLPNIATAVSLIRGMALHLYLRAYLLGICCFLGAANHHRLPRNLLFYNGGNFKVTSGFSLYREQPNQQLTKLFINYYQENQIKFQVYINIIKLIRLLAVAPFIKSQHPFVIKLDSYFVNSYIHDF